jgi:hypothetical protein
MSTLFRTLATSTGFVQFLLDLTTWLLARSLQMPEPLVHAAAVFLLLRVQAIENAVGRSFCPVRLLRRLFELRRRAT